MPEFSWWYEIFNGWFEQNLFAVLWISMLIGLLGAGGIVWAWFQDDEEFIF